MAQAQQVMVRVPFWYSLTWKLPRALTVVGGALVLTFVMLSVGIFRPDNTPAPIVPSQISAIEATATPTAVPTATAIPVIKEWPKMQVEWTEVAPTPGVYLIKGIEGDGFYTGTRNTQNGAVSTPEGLAYIATILPQEFGGVAAARNENIVFVSISGRNQSYLLISFDGEKSWQELNLPPLHAPIAGVPAIRIEIEGSSVHLTARDNTVQEKWWVTSIKRD